MKFEEIQSLHALFTEIAKYTEGVETAEDFEGDYSPYSVNEVYPGYVHRTAEDHENALQLLLNGIDSELLESEENSWGGLIEEDEKLKELAGYYQHQGYNRK
ncbi:MAG: UPF0058 family protein, partial [Candidatus Aenigmatarchaeota archaeon]